ncbi:hypothetical protein PR048_004619 [Dryococelus australis]|uniref:Transposase n=1 Tax=Dryococelus australis TaxID=614101 RepID=A0ABQ9I5Y6_9NEOP|nr:hypothetical protein PR048_004619 [Dryococelus australis]
MGCGAEVTVKPAPENASPTIFWVWGCCGKRNYISSNNLAMVVRPYHSLEVYLGTTPALHTFKSQPVPHLVVGWVMREEKVEEIQESALWMLDAGIVGCDAGDGWVWVVSKIAVEYLCEVSDQVGWRLYVAQAIHKFDGFLTWPAKDD